MTVTYEQVREWVLELPGGREVHVAEWGHPTLRVGDKILAMGQEGGTELSVKAGRQEQAELLAASPEVYEKAAYVGRFGWVRVDLEKVDPGELRDLVEEAWRRTAPKKAVREFDARQED
ncbi:MmcQ/YjbR family DNA-binding protein [Phytomonospora sp. NPDC050363]|uniref:MmcQ/YjbR family DNA-binding protein n=1 Tax=Phytomonospora sp. NPDC050363 TaxID=3155642 RepID=UPI0033D688FF